MAIYDRFTRAFQEGMAPFDREGPALEVQPFAPGEVTPEGGILRAITAIGAARRARANYEALQRDKQASRYRDVLETGLLEKRLNAPDYDQLRLNEQIRHNKETEAAFKERTGKMGARGAGGSTTRPPSAAATSLALDTLNKEADTWVNDRLVEPRIAPGGKRQLSIAETGQMLVRQLRHQDPQKRLEAQRALGVQPATEPSAITDPKTGKVSYEAVPVMRGELPTYDNAAVSKALEGWLATRRKALRSEWDAQNAARVGAYRKVAQSLGLGGIPQYDEASDPLEDAALELFGSQ